ncbi:MAG: hypothetical protein KDA91_06955 [Planctomycetaceae bacterium]|nr:hypothetical protein [Planctomycetaceae bacterium]
MTENKNLDHVVKRCIPSRSDELHPSTERQAGFSRKLRQIPVSMAGVCLLAMICSASGCQSLIRSPAQLFEKEPEFVTPTKIIPVWSDTVLHQVGTKGQRGCGGRVMFYAGDGKRAVRVDGSLVVYVWNDSDNEEQRKPDRKYVFPADDLQKHYSTSPVGESYSFWIPWDGTDGERTRLTLVARFVGRNGAEITSAPGQVILPGRIPELAKKERRREQTNDGVQTAAFQTETPVSVQQVKFEDPMPTPGKQLPLRTLTTAEIPLTDGFLKRNMQGPQAYTPDELLDTNAPMENYHSHQEMSQSDLLPSGLQNTILEAADHVEDRSHVRNSSENMDFNSLPEDRSLQFQHRVQTRRAAQRSVGRALSERYQSELRTAPWDRE